MRRRSRSYEQIISGEVLVKIFRTIQLLVLSLGLLAILPLGAQAATAIETVTMQVNLTSPRGMKVIGTVVAYRTLGSVVNTELSFNGMINGAPASGNATAVEHWLGNGKEDIEITGVSNWRGPVDALAPMNLHLEQHGSGVISVNGVPVAMNGVLQPPGSGDLSYTFTDAGQGSHDIGTLPNTGLGDTLPMATDLPTRVALISPPGTAGGFEALVVVGLLMSASVVILCLRLVWRERSV
jgi:hypothetical protein